MTTDEFPVGFVRLALIAAVMVGMWWAWPQGGPWRRHWMWFV